MPLQPYYDSQELSSALDLTAKKLVNFNVLHVQGGTFVRKSDKCQHYGTPRISVAFIYLLAKMISYFVWVETIGNLRET